MSGSSIEISGGTLVVVGDFLPSMFSPDWLLVNGLIGASDADAARQEDGLVLSKHVTQIQADWFQLQVLSNKLTLNSKGPLGPTLRDLAVGLFTVIGSAPISAIGMNFFAHYKFVNIDDAHRLGDVVAPKAVWEKLFPDSERGFGLDHLMISVQPFKRGEAPTSDDRIRITVQPSRVVTPAGHGVFLNFNDHRELVGQTSSVLPKLLTDEWEVGFAQAFALFDRLVTSILKPA